MTLCGIEYSVNRNLKENIMNLDKKQAKKSLNEIQQTMQKTARAIESSEASPFLILWGAVWVLAYTASHYYLQYVHIIMWAMSAIGGIGSFVITMQQRSKNPIKSTSPKNPSRKIGVMWFSVFAYASILLFILQPFNGLQMNAVIVITVMLAYIIMGLWFSSRLLLTLGVAITLSTLIGYAVLTPYYCIWMAATGGLTLLLTGIIIKLKWRF